MVDSQPPEFDMSEMKRFGRKLANKAMFHQDEMKADMDKVIVKCNRNRGRSFRNGVKMCHSCPLYLGGICILFDKWMKEEDGEGDEDDD